MLRETAVKFVTKETLAKLLTPLVRAGGFGRSLPLATLRLLSFHPIQSALSTELKTGQARIPTAQRVHCTEAVAYAELLAGIDETERRMKDWMTMALALVARGSDDAKLADIRAAGDALLKGRRGAAFGRDRDAIAADFAAATPALVAAAATLRGFSSAANAVLGDRAAAQFDTDRARFAEAFADLYLGAQARPA